MLDLEKHDKQEAISTLEAILARLRGDARDPALAADAGLPGGGDRSGAATNGLL